MSEVTEEEFDFLKRRADALGLYINLHREFDGRRGGGPLYIQARKKVRREKTSTLIKYATPEQCWEFFQTFEDVKRETSDG